MPQELLPSIDKSLGMPYHSFVPHPPTDADHDLRLPGLRSKRGAGLRKRHTPAVRMAVLAAEEIGRQCLEEEERHHRKRQSHVEWPRRAKALPHPPLRSPEAQVDMCSSRIPTHTVRTHGQGEALQREEAEARGECRESESDSRLEAYMLCMSDRRHAHDLVASAANRAWSLMGLGGEEAAARSALSQEEGEARMGFYAESGRALALVTAQPVGGQDEGALALGELQTAEAVIRSAAVQEEADGRIDLYAGLALAILPLIGGQTEVTKSKEELDLAFGSGWVSIPKPEDEGSAFPGTGLDVSGSNRVHQKLSNITDKSRDSVEKSRDSVDKSRDSVEQATDSVEHSTLTVSQMQDTQRVSYHPLPSPFEEAPLAAMFPASNSIKDLRLETPEVSGNWQRPISAMAEMAEIVVANSGFPRIAKLALVGNSTLSPMVCKSPARSGPNPGLPFSLQVWALARWMDLRRFVIQRQTEFPDESPVTQSLSRTGTASSRRESICQSPPLQVTMTSENIAQEVWPSSPPLAHKLLLPGLPGSGRDITPMLWVRWIGQLPQPDRFLHDFDQMLLQTKPDRGLQKSEDFYAKVRATPLGKLSVVMGREAAGQRAVLAVSAVSLQMTVVPGVAGKRELAVATLRFRRHGSADSILSSSRGRSRAATISRTRGRPELRRPEGRRRGSLPHALDRDDGGVEDDLAGLL
eukprot:Hpha_TRINITY_DN10830_c0_g1::TRINITY_DN10830_c0_g1_i1::g.23344::m.23344